MHDEQHSQFDLADDEDPGVFIAPHLLPPETELKFPEPTEATADNATADVSADDEPVFFASSDAEPSPAALPAAPPTKLESTDVTAARMVLSLATESLARVTDDYEAEPNDERFERVRAVKDAIARAELDLKLALRREEARAKAEAEQLTAEARARIEEIRRTIEAKVEAIRATVDEYVELRVQASQLFDTALRDAVRDLDLLRDEAKELSGPRRLLDLPVYGLNHLLAEIRHKLAPRVGFERSVHL